MRILHTSDWHLGQSFFSKSRQHEHQAFTAWLLNLVREEGVDAVIIAGDVFDSGTPPSYARQLYNQFVVDLHQQHCSLVVLGGNHDSVATLNESKQLLSQLTTHVIANTNDDLASQVIALKRSDGATGALVCAVPFVRARDVMQSYAGDSGTGKQKQLGDAIKAHYHQLYQHAVEVREAQGLDVPIVATGHLTAMGVTKADSERDIYIGSLDGFSADGFPPADYIALGHIHRPQIVAKSAHIRYSGSPIPLSFDEVASTKQVVLVTFDGTTQVEINPIDVPCFQSMAYLKGDLVSIEQQLATLSTSSEQPVWLAIEVEVQDFLSDLQQRIQTLTTDLNVEVLQLRRARAGRQTTLSQQSTETLAELTPFDVFDKRLAQELFEGEEQTQRLSRIKQTFREVVEAVATQVEEEAATPSAEQAASNRSASNPSASKEQPQ